MVQRHIDVVGCVVLLEVAFLDKVTSEIERAIVLLISNILRCACGDKILADFESTQFRRLMKDCDSSLVPNVQIGSTLEQFVNQPGPSVLSRKDHGWPLFVEVFMWHVEIRTGFQNDACFFWIVFTGPP